MAKVWPLQLAHTDKLVLLALADNANDEGQCWPSLGNLCEKTCLSDRAVQQCVGRLTSAGHVSVNRRYKKSNVFTVHPVSPEAASPERPSSEAPSPERNVSSDPNDVHPLNLLPKIHEPSKRTVRAKTQPRRVSRKHPIPDDFELTQERQAYAEKHLPHVDPIALMATFRSTSKAKGWEYVDWEQHWQTLVRQWAPNSGHWSSGRYPTRGGKPNGKDPYANAI